MDIPHLGTPPERIESFCRKWKVTELALFSSILTDEFRPDSDFDVLVTFAEDEQWTLWNFEDMREELVKIFERDVDRVTKRSLRNPFRRHNILKSKRVVYAA